MSKLVLLDSDFTVVPDMVMEGRCVVNNVTKFGGVFLIKTIYSVLLSILSIIMMRAFPFVPVQITLYDFAVEAYPSFLLMMEPENSPIRGKFLPNVIRRATPYAVLILVNIIVITVIGPTLGVSGMEAVTVMYYITSFAGLLAVFKACRPFSLARAFIFITAFFGFYGPTFLFAGFLHVTPLTLSAILLFAGLALLCPAIKFILSKLTNMAFEQFGRDKATRISGK